MTPERLRQLIDAGENRDVEFKGEERESLNDRALIEAVVCLANRAAEALGWLLVGVEDDGRVTGARHRNSAPADPHQVQALIANRTTPSHACRVELVNLDGVDILVVEVPSARTPVGTRDGVYVRRGLGGRGEPACLPFHFHEMQALQAHRGLLDYSALPVPGAGWRDLDQLEFARLRRTIRESRGRGDASLLALPDREIATALGATLPDGTIFYEQLRNGRPVPSYERSTPTGVVVVIPGGPANLHFVRLVAEEGLAERPLRLDDLLLLNGLWLERRLDAAQASAFTQKPEAETRGALERLVEAGLVEARGDRNRTYHLAAATYRRLGEEAAYVRQRGFEPIQQEPMVIQYARKHGRITRQQTATLCRLSSPQARDLLSRLVARGDLKLHGQKRGAFYTPTAKEMDESKTRMDESKTAKPRPKRRRES